MYQAEIEIKKLYMFNLFLCVELKFDGFDNLEVIQVNLWGILEVVVVEGGGEGGVQGVFQHFFRNRK